MNEIESRITAMEIDTAQYLLGKIKSEEPREIQYYSHCYDQLMHAISLRRPAEVIAAAEPIRMSEARLESTEPEWATSMGKSLNRIAEILTLLTDEVDKMDKRLDSAFGIDQKPDRVLKTQAPEYRTVQHP